MNNPDEKFVPVMDRIQEKHEKYQEKYEKYGDNIHIPVNTMYDEDGDVLSDEDRKAAEDKELDRIASLPIQDDPFLFRDMTPNNDKERAIEA